MPITRKSNAAGYVKYFGGKGDVVVDLNTPKYYKNGINLNYQTFRIQGNAAYIRAKLFEFKDLEIKTSGRENVKVIISEQFTSLNMSQAAVNSLRSVLLGEIFIQSLNIATEATTFTVESVMDIQENLVGSKTNNNKILHGKPINLLDKANSFAINNLLNSQEKTYQLDIVQYAPPHHHRASVLFDTGRKNLTFAQLGECCRRADIPGNNTKSASKVEKKYNQICELDRQINSYSPALDHNKSYAIRAVSSLKAQRSRIIRKYPEALTFGVKSKQVKLRAEYDKQTKLLAPHIALLKKYNKKLTTLKNTIDTDASADLDKVLVKIDKYERKITKLEDEHVKKQMQDYRKIKLKLRGVAP